MVLFLVGSFDSAGESFFGSAVKSFDGALDVVKSFEIIGGRVRAALKRLQPIRDDGQEGLLRDAVDARFFDRAVLEVDGNDLAAAGKRFEADFVLMTRATGTGFIDGANCESFIQPVDFVGGDFAGHVIDLSNLSVVSARAVVESYSSAQAMARQNRLPLRWA